MKLFKIFLTGFIFFVLGFGVWAQDIDDEEIQQVKPAKIIEEKVVLPIQPPKPKPTPIEIQPIEPKAESKQRFILPSSVTPPEREQEPVSTGQFWFKQPSPVTVPAYQGGDAQQRFQFQKPTPVTAPDYHNPHNPNGTSSIPFKQPDFLANIPSSPSIGSYQPEYGRMQFQEPRSVQGASSVYSTARLDDFTGGLNRVDFPNKIADNEAIDLINFVWTSAGKLKSRPGFTKYNTSEFDASERIWGLYPYTTSDGENFLLAGVNGTLWADTTDFNTGSFVSVKTGLTSNSKYYDFETFKGKVIVAHEGDYPFWYDGNTTENLGLIATANIAKAKHPNTCDPGANPCCYTEAWFLIPPIGDVEDDHFVGYTAKWECAGGWFSEFIVKYRHGEAKDTVFLPSMGYCWPDTGLIFKILANFSKGVTVDSGIIDTSDVIRPGLPPVCGYYFKAYDFDKSWSLNTYIRYIIEVKGSEENEGYTRYIQGNGTDYLRIGLYLSEREDTASFPFQAGTEYRIRTLGFNTARLVKIYKNRVFLVAREQDPAFAERIVFSEDNDLNDFSPDNYFTVKTEDGDKITALATFYDDQLGYKDRSRDCLVIFKQNSIYKLVWNSATDYYLVQVTDNVGCVAPKSVVNVEGKYLLFFHSTGVYAFDGRTVTLVSKKVQPLIDNIQPTQLHSLTGGYYDHHYYLNYAKKGEGLNRHTLIFNTDFGAWSQAGGIWTSLYAQQEVPLDTIKLLFTHIDSNFIYEFGRATTDMGEAISLFYKSKAFDFNSMADRKRFTYFDFDYYLDAGNFTTYFYTDFGDSLRYNKTISEYGGYRYSHIPLDGDCLGRNFSFKITSSNKLELGKIGIKFKKIRE